MKFDEIKLHARCCVCCRPMTESFHDNFIMLNKRAVWEFPIWDNMLLKEGIPRIKRATAVVCDGCLQQKKEPQWAIEVKNENVIYHEISALEDVFEITSNMLKEYP